MLGSTKNEHPKLTNGEIIELQLKNCNLCDHNISTSRTDDFAVAIPRSVQHCTIKTDSSFVQVVQFSGIVLTFFKNYAFG